jgi:predicted transcriptional regulator
MSSAYVDMMIRSLVENGFLITIALRKHEITPSGEKFLEGKK